MYQPKESTRGSLPPSTGSCVKHDREIKVVINVDTSALAALDAALEKAQRLLDLTNEVNKGAMHNA